MGDDIIGEREREWAVEDQAEGAQSASVSLGDQWHISERQWHDSSSSRTTGQTSIKSRGGGQGIESDDEEEVELSDVLTLAAAAASSSTYLVAFDARH